MNAVDKDQLEVFYNELGIEPTPFDDIDKDGGSWDNQWADMLPDWNPRHRQYGLYVDGQFNVAVGHTGGGKSRSLSKICQLMQRYVDRAACVSTTDRKNGTYGRNGLFHPAYINEKPTLKDVQAILDEREGEVNLQDKYRDYRTRRLLYIMDDAAYASKVLGSKSDAMSLLVTNKRHYELHLFLALQTMGFLTKQYRMNVDLVFIVKEHNGEAMAAIYDGLFKFNTPIRPSVFREMMDQVCIKGKRVMVYDNRIGRLFKWALDFDQIRLPRPLGNSWWLAKGDKILKDQRELEQPEDRLSRAVRERWREDKKGRK